jgi:hypothetical protein
MVRVSAWTLALGGFLAAVTTGVVIGQDGVVVELDDDDVGGVVSSSNGPEAGVWVIAETSDLPTTFRKIVVTDDQGRYLLPDLPEASYEVWVRGYGLVDSRPLTAVPGERLDLPARLAPDAQSAAEVYPANSWYSLIDVPAASEFPGTGPDGNGINPQMRTQADWINQMKTTCELCHQLGTKATREIPEFLGRFASTAEAWDHRVQVGQDGLWMSQMMDAFGRERAVEMFADWTDRISAGEVPEAPPRPEGLERNLVLTMWNWGQPSAFVHDEITTDKRNPTVNAHGPLYGADYGNDELLIVDPNTHEVRAVHVPSGPNAPSAKPQSMLQPSPYWGDELYWNDPAHPHNPMMDAQGRVWMTSGVRGAENPDHCRAGSNNRFAAYAPIEQSGMHASVYDPRTNEVSLIDTCFGTHHLQFAEDADDTLYFSSGGNVVGWVKTRVWDLTGDALAAQGWCPLIVDYNGDGVIGEFTEIDEPVNPMLDRRVRGGGYGIIVNPVDGSVWYSSPGVPGRIVRLEVGSNPPYTCRAEVFEPPFDNPGFPGVNGYTPRGIDVDRNGLIWTALASSGHMASFDRNRCDVLSGPEATGQHCPEGWTLYQSPGPRFAGVDNVAVDHHYYSWVDQFDTLGLGPNIPMANGTGSDSLLALQPNGEWVILRVPYPLGFYTRGLDGRIDDPTTGWKGRGVYADYGPNSVWHVEGGLGTQGAIVKFQLRPDPVAK